MYNSEVDTRKHITKVSEYLGGVIRRLVYRQVEHDASKLKDPEKKIFDKYTPKLAGSTYGSDEYKKMLAEMKPALDHHYHNNRHHPEFFQIAREEDNLPLVKGLVDMNMVDIIEMLCDWKAASERHKDGDIFKSIEINQKRFGYGAELKSILVNTALNLFGESNV